MKRPALSAHAHDTDEAEAVKLYALYLEKLMKQMNDWLSTAPICNKEYRYELFCNLPKGHPGKCDCALLWSMAVEDIPKT